MGHSIEVQPLVQTVILTIDGTEYDLPIEQAKEVYKQLGEALKAGNKEYVINNFFITTPTDETVIADSIARELFWDLTNT